MRVGKRQAEKSVLPYRFILPLNKKLQNNHSKQVEYQMYLQSIDISKRTTPFKKISPFNRIALNKKAIHNKTDRRKLP